MIYSGMGQYILRTAVCKRKSFGILVVVLLLSSLFQGCSFYALDGGGSVSHRQAIEWLQPDVAEISQSDKDLVLALDFKGMGRSGVLHGKRVEEGIPQDLFDLPVFEIEGKGMRHYGGTPLVGMHDNYLLIDAFDKDTSLYVHEKRFGPGYAIPFYFWPWWKSSMQTFDLGSGRLVHDEVLVGLGVTSIVACYHRKMMAVDITQVDREDAVYDYKNVFLLGSGLLGFGRVNNRRYLQLLWIPIPLWTVDAFSNF